MKIGNAGAFWGDQPGAAARLISLQNDVDFITLDYLAEVSMSILAKESSKGYAEDFLEELKGLIPFWKKGLPFKVVVNAGGLNPKGCAEACLKILLENKCPKKIGIVSGDNVLSFMKDKSFITANAYLGADGIVNALNQGADIVITGRIADPSLVVGPCRHHFKWKETDYDKIAGATIAGHIIECGTQATGGISTRWLELKNPFNIGYPIVDVSSDGSFIVTKPPNTGGIVSIETVKEQLLYEIGDPEKYLSPDATVSFLNLNLSQEGENKIRVTGALGKAPPPNYKVSATFHEGYRAEGILTLFGRDLKEKGKRCGEIVFDKVKRAGYDLERTNIECIGLGSVVPGVFEFHPKECVLRLSAQDKRKEALECFSKEIAPLVTCGPQGVTGYFSGRPKVRPVIGYFPTEISRKEIATHVEILS